MATGSTTINIGHWICTVCTFINTDAMIRCEICTSPRPNTEATNSIHNPSNVTEVTEVTEVMKHKRLNDETPTSEEIHIHHKRFKDNNGNARRVDPNRFVSFSNNNILYNESWGDETDENEPFKVLSASDNNNDTEFGLLLHQLSSLDIDKQNENKNEHQICPICSKCVMLKEFADHVCKCLNTMDENKRNEITKQIEQNRNDKIIMNDKNIKPLNILNKEQFIECGKSLILCLKDSNKYNNMLEMFGTLGFNEKYIKLILSKENQQKDSNLDIIMNLSNNNSVDTLIDKMQHWDLNKTDNNNSTKVIDVQDTLQFGIPFTAKQPKYENLKDEILNNQIKCIHLKSFNDTLTKCISLLISKHSKINLKGCLSLQHLIALKLYTDFDELQRALKKCYANIQDAHCQTHEQIQREFFQWNHSLQDACNKSIDVINCKLYFGVDKPLLTSPCFGIYYGPLSTTTEFNVAAQFAGLNGQILELLPSYTTKGLQVSWLSDFSNEQEVFYMNPLIEFTKIHSNYNGNNAINAINAIDVFDRFDRFNCNAFERIRTDGNIYNVVSNQNEENNNNDNNNCIDINMQGDNVRDNNNHNVSAVNMKDTFIDKAPQIISSNINDKLENESYEQRVTFTPGFHEIPCERTIYSTKAMQISRNNMNTGSNKVIMVVGETGAGKSSFLNSMINYIYNVQFEDDYRLKMGQLITSNLCTRGTDDISAYFVRRPQGSNINYDLTVIDTPGFGDTCGGLQDLIQFEHQLSIVKNMLGSIDAICFAVRAPVMRFDALHKYIFNSILNLWGKNVKQNIFFLMTFADAQDPPVLNAIRNQDILAESQCLKLNNSVYQKTPQKMNRTNEMEVIYDKLLWKMGTMCFDSLFKAIKGVNSASTTHSTSICQNLLNSVVLTKSQSMVNNNVDVVNSEQLKEMMILDQLDIVCKDERDTHIDNSYGNLLTLNYNDSNIDQNIDSNNNNVSFQHESLIPFPNEKDRSKVHGHDGFDLISKNQRNKSHDETPTKLFNQFKKTLDNVYFNNNSEKETLADLHDDIMDTMIKLMEEQKTNKAEYKLLTTRIGDIEGPDKMDEKDLNDENYWDNINKGMFTIKLDFDYYGMKNNENNQSKFINEIAKAVKVEKEQIKINDIRKGSSIIDFVVTNCWNNWYVKKLLIKTGRLKSPQNNDDKSIKEGVIIRIEEKDATVQSVISNDEQHHMHGKIVKVTYKKKNAFYWRNTQWIWYYATKHISVLSLICPGSGRYVSSETKRKRAIKQNGKDIHSNDGENIFIQSSIDLQGTSEDKRKLTEWRKKLKNVEYLSSIKPGMKLLPYESNKSFHGAGLDKKSAMNSIRDWINEQHVIEYVLYFSGHGKKEGIIFADGLLRYKYILEHILSKIERKQTVNIIIDACYSGGIVNALKEIRKENKKEYISRIKNIICWYSCTENEISADFGSDGGAFTKQIFDPNQYNLWIDWFSGHINFKIFDLIHQKWKWTYKNGTTQPQNPGVFSLFWVV